MTELRKIKNLYEYIDMIQTRTAMYTGSNSLSALYFHVSGYLMACEIKGIYEELSPDFELFNDFVADYYMYGESTAGWRNIILSECYGDEQQALKEFYKLFDLFKQNKKATNSKKILFGLLERVAMNQDFIVRMNKSDKRISERLALLPGQLGQIVFNHQYDYLLDEINELAVSDEYLKSMLNEIKESV